MIDAMMTPEELTEACDRSGHWRGTCARMLDVTLYELRKMERGEEPIPARFDDDIEWLGFERG